MIQLFFSPGTLHTMDDPMENGLYDIPDYDRIDDEAFPALPPPHSPGQGGADEADPFANGEGNTGITKLHVCQCGTNSAK